MYAFCNLVLSSYKPTEKTISAASFVRSAGSTISFPDELDYREL